MNLRKRSAAFANYLAMGISSYRARLIVHSSFLIAAILVGIAAVYFTSFIAILQTFNARLFVEHPYFMSAFTPVTFFLATAVVKFFAPHAGGSGVPQVLHASSLGEDENQNVVVNGLLSIRTACIKVISTGVGLIGGASIGGEGPTVQISGSIFATFGNLIRRYFPNIDFHSYLVAAAGAGIASAFNTPLGGVVFALEEVAVGDFGELRHVVMLAVIVAGLAAQALAGDKLYFGKFILNQTPSLLLLSAVLIGIIGGLFGGLFGRIVASERLYRMKINWWQRALICGVLVAAIDLAFDNRTAGSGYEATRDFMNDSDTRISFLFPLGKLLATALSTLSGMGGGILAPSLSIGAFLGVSTGQLALLLDLKVCALLGMVAYFTGAFQIPMTAVIVVMETTGQHDLIIPMMVAALAAFLSTRVVMPVPLYHVLIKRSFSKKTLSD